MPDSTVNIAFVQQFKDSVIMLAQQRGSRLSDTVMTRSVVGKYDHWERIGATEAQAVTTRHADTPLIEVPHSRRRVIPGTDNWATLLDKRDEIRMLIDPKNPYTRAGSYAMGRTRDDKIIAAFTGDSIAVDSSDAGSAIALPSSQIIAQDYSFAGGGPAVDLTVEKLIKAREIIVGSDVDIEDPENRLYCMIDAISQTSLLNDAKYVNRDFGMPVLDQGIIKSFMGVSFIHSERGLSDPSGDKICPFWAKSAVGLSIGRDVTVDIAQRKDKNNAWQVYMEMDCGATRVEEEKVVSIVAAR